MNFDFYQRLSEGKKKQYDFMLLTNYILLRCDEWSFVETDENDEESLSVSWILSIQPTLKLFGLDPMSYPQGSVSADRNYYECLRSFVGKKFYQENEFEFIRKGLKNFLRLRCDNSGPYKTFLYGSFYEIRKLSGTRDPRKYRHIDVNIRHSATALWILTVESIDEFNSELVLSIKNYFERVSNYLNGNEDWKKDRFKHLTIASTINLCNSIIKHKNAKEIVYLASEIKKKAIIALFSNECFKQTVDGTCKWIIPDYNDHKMAFYENYLIAFSLCQIPELLEDSKIRYLLESVVRNKVGTPAGWGIPINNYYTSESNQKINQADFGATASVIYLLWYSIENKLGDDNWQSFCESNFIQLLDFCLNTYNKSDIYILPHSENNSKILLLPNTIDYNKLLEIKPLIEEIKQAIRVEMNLRNNKLTKSLKKIKTPEEFKGVVNIINSWNIPAFWKNQNKWDPDPVFNWGKVGEFIGGVIKSMSSN